MLNKIKNIALCVALVVAAFYYIKDRIRDRQHDIDMGKIEFMEKNLNRLVDISRDSLRDVYKKDGKVKVRTTFIPREGNVRVIEDKDGKVTVVKKTKGFTFRPGIAVYYADDKARLDGSVKVMYWNRLSLNVHGNNRGMGLSVSRYVDDLIPYWHPSNLEGFLQYRALKFSSGEATWIIGARITL